MSEPSHQPTIQELRVEAHQFFTQLKGDLATVEADIDSVTRELARLHHEREKVAASIAAIEDEALRQLGDKAVEFLNEADEMGERAEAL